MNILLYTLYFTPDIGPDPLLMSTLAEDLVKLGNKVTVICAFPHYKRNKLPDNYSWKLFEIERPSTGYRIIRTWVSVPSDERILKRLLNYLSFMVAGIFAGLLNGPTQHVLVYTPPPTNGIAGYVVSRIWNASMTYNVQDIYPDIGIKLGIFRNKWIIRISQAIENFLYAKSAAITVISPGFRKNLLAKGVPENKLHLIFNWVDTAFIKPLPFENSLRKSRNWGNDFILLYAGNIGLSQNLSDVLTMAKYEELPGDIRFVIVGEGFGRQKLEQEAINSGLTNVEFADFFPENQLPLLLASANVSLVMMKPEVVNESVPSKVASIMASGRPILGVVPTESDTWKIIAESNSGLCVKPGCFDDFLSAILALYHDRELDAQMGRNGRDWVIKNCDPMQAALKYQSIFNSLSEAKRNKKKQSTSPKGDLL
jgi:colanic acid biosynthesis glycosyl transferase WcaI